MILTILRLFVAALLALTGVTAEDELLSSGEVVTEECVIQDEGEANPGECTETTDSTTTPSELSGPSD